MRGLLHKVLQLAGVLLLAAAMPVLAQQTAATVESPTLRSILERGELACGVNQDLIGFGSLNPDTGEIEGLQVEFCRALAAAVFGDVNALQLLPQTAETGAQALIDREIDVLFSDAPVTFSQDSQQNIDFGPVYYYDGLSFMVGSSSNLNTWADLSNATVCISNDADALSMLQRQARARGVTVAPVTYEGLNRAADAFYQGNCEVLTALQGQLIEQRTRATPADAYVVWSQPYTQIPFASMTLQEDPVWADLVSWTVYGLINAEELGLTSENVDNELRLNGEQDDAYIARVGGDVARLVDPTLGLGGRVGLAPNYMLEVIRQVGSYAELFDRHLGAMGIPRGQNALPRDGGLLYAPSWR